MEHQHDPTTPFDSYSLFTVSLLYTISNFQDILCKTSGGLRQGPSTVAHNGGHFALDMLVELAKSGELQTGTRCAHVAIYVVSRFQRSTLAPR